MGRMRFDRVPVGAWMALGRSVGGAINAGNAPEAEIQQERTQLSETNAPGKDMVYDEDTGQYVQGYLDQSTPSGLSSTGDAQQNAKVKDPPVDVKTQTPTFKSVWQYGLGGEWRDKEYTPKEVKRYNDNRSIDYWKKKGEFGLDMVKSLRADQTAEDSQVLHEIQTEAARGQLAEQKRNITNRDEIANIGKEGEEALRKFYIGEGMPGNTPDLIRIGNNNKLVATLMAQGNIKDANELRKVNEQYASGVGLAALNRGDLGTVGTLMSNHSGRKYENLATAKGGDGETYITGTIDGKPFQMPERNAYNELAAIAFPGQVYNDKFNFANKNADLKREAMFLAALLKGNNTGGGGSRGSVGTRATSSNTDDGFGLSRLGIKDQKEATGYIDSILDKVAQQEPIIGADGKTPVDKSTARVEIGRQMAQLAKFNPDITDADSAMAPALKIARASLSGNPLPTAPVMKNGVWREGISIDGQNLLVSGNQFSDDQAAIAMAGPNAKPEVLAKAKEFVNDKRNDFWMTEARMYKALDANLAKDPTGRALEQYLQAKNMTRKDYEKQRDDAIGRGESLEIDANERNERIREYMKGGSANQSQNTTTTDTQQPKGALARARQFKEGFDGDLTVANRSRPMIEAKIRNGYPLTSGEAEIAKQLGISVK